jgi:hypothetical protein
MRENDPDTGRRLRRSRRAAAGAAGSPTAPFIPIANFRRFAAIYMTSVGTGGITAFSIMAATSAAGAGAVAVVTHALGSNPDAVGDFVTLECTSSRSAKCSRRPRTSASSSTSSRTPTKAS